MKTSLRLAFSAVAISFITLAASGKPLPFLTPAHAAKPPSAILAPPADAASAPNAALPAAFNHFDHQ